MAWVAAITIAFAGHRYSASRLGSTILISFGPVRWETTIWMFLLARAILAALAWCFFKALAEVFGWMLVVEDHLRAIREQARPRSQDQ